MDGSQGVRLDLSPKEILSLHLARLNRRLRVKRGSPRSYNPTEDRSDTSRPREQHKHWKHEQLSQQARPINGAIHPNQGPVSPDNVLSWISPQSPFAKWRKPFGAEGKPADFEHACCLPGYCGSPVGHTARQLSPAGKENQHDSPSPQSTLAVDGFRPYHHPSYSRPQLYPPSPKATSQFFSHPGMLWPSALRRTLSCNGTQEIPTTPKFRMTSPKAVEAPTPRFGNSVPLSFHSDRPLIPTYEPRWGVKIGPAKQQLAHTYPQEQPCHPAISGEDLCRTFPGQQNVQTAMDYLALTPGRLSRQQRRSFQNEGAFRKVSDAPCAPPPLSRESQFHARSRSEQFRDHPQAVGRLADQEETKARQLTVPRRIEVVQAEPSRLSVSSEKTWGEAPLNSLPPALPGGQLPKALSWTSPPPSLISVLRVYYNTKAGKPPPPPAPEAFSSLSSTYPPNHPPAPDSRGRFHNRGNSSRLSFGPPMTPRTSPSPRTRSWLRSSTAEDSLNESRSAPAVIAAGGLDLKKGGRNQKLHEPPRGSQAQRTERRVWGEHQRRVNSTTEPSGSGQEECTDRTVHLVNTWLDGIGPKHSDVKSGSGGGWSSQASVNRDGSNSNPSRTNVLSREPDADIGRRKAERSEEQLESSGGKQETPTSGTSGKDEIDSQVPLQTEQVETLQNGQHLQEEHPNRPELEHASREREQNKVVAHGSQTSEEGRRYAAEVRADHLTLQDWVTFAEDQQDAMQAQSESNHCGGNGNNEKSGSCEQSGKARDFQFDGNCALKQGQLETKEQMGPEGCQSTSKKSDRVQVSAQPMPGLQRCQICGEDITTEKAVFAPAGCSHFCHFDCVDSLPRDKAIACSYCV